MIAGVHGGGERPTASDEQQRRKRHAAQEAPRATDAAEERVRPVLNVRRQRAHVGRSALVHRCRGTEAMPARMLCTVDVHTRRWRALLVQMFA